MATEIFSLLLELWFMMLLEGPMPALSPRMPPKPKLRRRHPVALASFKVFELLLPETEIVTLWRVDSAQ